MKSPTLPTATLDGLIGQLRTLIQQGRQQILRAVDTVQIRTCWEIGHHIVEFEQGGAARAEYGEKLLPQLAKHLTAEFGKGFDARNLWFMRSFYQKFPILNATRSELSWTHYRLLLRVEHEPVHLRRMNEAHSQNWSTRALELSYTTRFLVTLQRQNFLQLLT